MQSYLCPSGLVHNFSQRSSSTCMALRNSGAVLPCCSFSYPMIRQKLDKSFSGRVIIGGLSYPKIRSCLVQAYERPLLFVFALS